MEHQATSLGHISGACKTALFN